GGPGLYAYGNAVLNAGSSSGQRDANHLCQGLGLTVEDGGVLYARYNYWWNDVIPTPTIIGSGSVYASDSRGLSNSACNSLSAMLARADQVGGEAMDLTPGSVWDDADVHAWDFQASQNREETLFAAKAR